MPVYPYELEANEGLIPDITPEAVLGAAPDADVGLPSRSRGVLR
jgi:hypothetical protein